VSLAKAICRPNLLQPFDLFHRQLAPQGRYNRLVNLEFVVRVVADHHCGIAEAATGAPRRCCREARLPCRCLPKPRQRSSCWMNICPFAAIFVVPIDLTRLPP
jgi:hypothetical protein